MNFVSNGNCRNLNGKNIRGAVCGWPGFGARGKQRSALIKDAPPRLDKWPLEGHADVQIMFRFLSSFCCFYKNGFKGVSFNWWPLLFCTSCDTPISKKNKIKIKKVRTSFNLLWTSWDLIGNSREITRSALERLGWHGDKKKTKVKEVKADKIHPLKVMMHSRVQRRKFPWMALHQGSWWSVTFFLPTTELYELSCQYMPMKPWREKIIINSCQTTHNMSRILILYHQLVLVD